MLVVVKSQDEIVLSQTINSIFLNKLTLKLHDYISPTDLGTKMNLEPTIKILGSPACVFKKQKKKENKKNPNISIFI